MNPSQRADTFESVDLSGVLRRRWWIVVVLAVVGLVAALGYALTAPKSYSATAQVYVTPTGADLNTPGSSSKSGSPTVDMPTEMTIAGSNSIALAAGKLMKSPLTAYQLQKEVSVSNPPSSQVLDIACHAPTADSAATCANAFANAYLANRKTTAYSYLTGQSSNIEKNVATLEKQLSALNTTISGLPATSPTRQSDEATASSDRTQIASFNGQISTLEGEAANVNGGHIISSASAPGSPSSPKKAVILPAGLIVGLVVGLIAAFVWDRRDKRLHSADDVERLLDIPVMLDLPRKSFGRQVSLASPRSRMGKAFTELAHTVAASLGEGSHVLLVAGTSPGPEASVVAANLAATLARTHSEAVLVCGDLQDSVATEMFGLSDSRGLSEVVAGRATVGEVARGPAGIPGLWVIPPGADTSLAEYHLQYDTAKALTTQLRRDARYVIIEAQATDDGADTFALAEFADAALLTIDVDHTSRQEAGSCVKRLHRMRTPILGAVTMPMLGRQITIRPPQMTQTRLGQPDGAVGGGRAHGELPPGPQDRGGPQDRPARYRDGHSDPADRV